MTEATTSITAANDPEQPVDEAQVPRQFNATDYFIERHLKEGRGGNCAVIDRNGETTYATLAERVSQAANMLQGLGLRQDARIALAMLDSVEYPTAFWGALKAGIVPVCLNTLLTSEHYQYILSDCRAQVLIVEDALLDRFEPLFSDLPHLERVIVVGAAGDHAPAWQDRLAAENKEATSAETLRDDIAFWLYSSGSTGNPKGVPHRHASLFWIAELYGRGVLGINEDDRIFSIAKLFFAYGLGNGMAFPFAVGATAIYHDGRPTPAVALELMEKHQPTIFCGVPTLYAALLGDTSLRSHPGSGALRRSISAGEALPSDVGHNWEKRFGTPILDGVGSTEMLHIFLSNRMDSLQYGTSGRPVPGYQLRLLDAQGNDVPHGDIGELLVRGPSTADSYWNQRSKSLQTFVGGWTYTGDKYYQDPEDRYHYCGRSDDMFKSAGNWVSPFEVESALIEHEWVLEAAVVSHADDTGNLKPCAYIVLNSDVALPSDEIERQIQAFVRERIELWKYPRWVRIVDELPKTATGKIQRFRLRDMSEDEV